VSTARTAGARDFGTITQAAKLVSTLVPNELARGDADEPGRNDRWSDAALATDGQGPEPSSGIRSRAAPRGLVLRGV
jgi:hypothetical protein